MNAQIIGILLAVPFIGFMVSNDLWAEPSPPKQKAFSVEICKAEPVVELEVETMFDEQIETLAKCVEAEAGNQSKLGKQMVADVILNRVASPSFPDSIKGVIEQKGQFSVVSNGMIDKAVPSEETWEAVISELNERIDESVLYFQTGSFPKYGEPYEQVGDHYFSK